MQNKTLKKSILSILNIKYIYILTFLGITISIISTIIPYISGCFINSIINKNAIIFNLVIMFFLQFSLIYCKKEYAYLIAKSAKYKTLELQRKYLQKVSSLPPFELEKFPNGVLGIKFLRDIQNATDILRCLYPQLIEFSCGLIFAIIFVFYSNIIMGFIFIMAIPASLFFLRSYIETFDRINVLLRKTNDAVFCRIFEIFYLLPFLKSISEEEFYKKQSQTKLANIAKISYINAIYEKNFNFTIALLLAIGEFFIIGFSAYLAYINVIKIGDIVFYQLIFISTFNYFSNIYKMLPNWATIKESLISLNELDILSSERLIIDSFNFNGNIELRNISFSYTPKSKPILKNLSLKILPGDFISIEGTNGSGKTTFLKILSGYLPPNSGEVFFDGIHFHNINLHSLRRNISIINQDFLLISDSIKNNITLHNNKYTIKEICDIVKLIGLNELIEKCPNGIDEIIGNNGRKLSGGETQKIAIARALIRKPKLVIFDEITNHLDKISRQFILELVASLKGKTTILFVSHYNNTNLDFDKIITLPADDIR